MAYSLSTENKGNYLYISVTGEQSFENNLQLARDCMEVCKNHGIRFLFLDITNLSGQPGYLADFEFAKLLNRWATEKYVTKTSIFEKASELEAGMFFENAARNRGVNIRVFADKDEALKWLLE